MYARIFGSTFLMDLCGETYLSDFIEQYLGKITSTEKNLTSYMRLFQVFDLHIPSIEFKILFL